MICLFSNDIKHTKPQSSVQANCPYQSCCIAAYSKTNLGNLNLAEDAEFCIDVCVHVFCTFTYAFKRTDVCVYVSYTKTYAFKRVDVCVCVHYIHVCVCTLGRVQVTLGRVQCTLGRVQCTLGRVQCTLVQCTL